MSYVVCRVSALFLIGLYLCAPANAATLYFNSYGWDSVYKLTTPSSLGAATLIPPTNILETTFFSQADFGLDGRMWGTSGSTFGSINVNGPTTVWTEYPDLAEISSNGLTWSPAGELYVAKLTSFHRVNPATGATIPGTTVNVSKLGGGTLQLQAIEFGTNGVLYGATSTEIYTINPTTGVGQLLYTPSSSPFRGVITELDYGADGVLRALGSFNYLLEYSPQSGTGSWSPWELNHNGSSFSPSSLASNGFAAIPEPGTWALLILGAAGSLGFSRRWRA